MVSISDAAPRDIEAVIDFLEANGLPDAGLGRHASHVLLARDAGRLVATAALETYGREALLRSVAVAASARGTGLGLAIARAAIERARAHGVNRVYLLTETAPRFFQRLGFAAIDREAVPDAIRRTEEFASACPASAAVMVLDMTGIRR